MFHPADKELLDLAYKGTTLPVSLLKEYMLRLRFNNIFGNHGPLGAAGLVDTIRHVGLEPPPEEKSKRINWRETKVGTAVKCIEDGRIGKYTQQISPGGIAIQFEGGEIEEIPSRLLELAPPELPPEIDEGDMFDEVGEIAEPLEHPDWKKTKRGDPLYAKVDGEMQDATLHAKTPGPNKCTVIVEDKEVVVEREQVFQPV